MGTRSETVIFEDDKALCKIYRQMDGYPDGHGLELAKLCNVKLVNGLSGEPNVANGMGCLSAQIIKGLKDGPGSIYMFDPTVPADEEYVYEVRGKEGELPTIKCISDGKVLFELPADKAVEWCAEDPSRHG